MKVLAIDFGMKRIGLAVGNTELQTASPLPPIIRKNSKQAIVEIKQWIYEYEIEQIAMGYPLHMDGTASGITEQVEHFTRRLQKSVGDSIGITFIDERLSSFEAEETLKPIHHDYKKRKKHLDSMSALILLKRFMEIR